MRRMASVLTALAVAIGLVAGCGSDRPAAPGPPPSSTARPGPPGTTPATVPVPGPGEPQGVPLACPFPQGPSGPPSTAQAADCLMARWAAGDQAGAGAFSTSSDAVTALFAVAPRGAPAALGCGDTGAGGAARACTYVLAGGGQATVVVTSTPERGAVVSSVTVT